MAGRTRRTMPVNYIDAGVKYDVDGLLSTARYMEKREELKTLKTQMLTIREKLQMKTMRIEEIKDTLKRSQLLTRGSIMAGKDVTGLQDQDVIDEVVKEYES